MLGVNMLIYDYIVCFHQLSDGDKQVSLWGEGKLCLP